LHIAAKKSRLPNYQQPGTGKGMESNRRFKKVVASHEQLLLTITCRTRLLIYRLLYNTEGVKSIFKGIKMSTGVKIQGVKRMNCIIKKIIL
jgi:hypothetical protein